MTAGDVLTFVVDADDDGTKLKVAITGKGIVVADDITMSKIGTRVWILVIKAA